MEGQTIGLLICLYIFGLNLVHRQSRDLLVARAANTPVPEPQLQFGFVLGCLLTV